MSKQTGREKEREAQEALQSIGWRSIDVHPEGGFCSNFQEDLLAWPKNVTPNRDWAFDFERSKFLQVQVKYRNSGLRHIYNRHERAKDPSGYVSVDLSGFDSEYDQYPLSGHGVLYWENHGFLTASLSGLWNWIFQLVDYSEKRDEFEYKLLDYVSKTDNKLRKKVCEWAGRSDLLLCREAHQEWVACWSVGMEPRFSDYISCRYGEDYFCQLVENFT